MAVRFYSRVSTEEQAASGLGLNAQGHTCVRLAKSAGFKAEDWADDRYGKDSVPGQYTDGGLSAWKVKLKSRPAGAALLEATKPGDTIIMSRLDRGFRSVIDFCDFISWCSKNKVVFICGTPRVNLGTANGRAMAQIYAVLSEWESSIRSERIKEGIATKKREELLGKGFVNHRVKKKVSVGSDWRPPVKASKRQGGVVTGAIHVYARCSAKSSLEDGYSIASQLHSTGRHAATIMDLDDGLTIGGEYVDGAVSALKHPLRERPAGRKLDADLKHGDHVVFLRVDRAFGSSLDFLQTVRDWNDRGVTIHFSEDGSCMSDEWGKLLIGVLSHFSEMERRLASARNKDMRKVLESQGRFCGGQGAPPFWRIYNIKSVQRLIMDPHQLLCFRFIKMCRDRGCTKKRACELLEEHLAKRENRPVIPQSGCVPRGKYANLPKGLIARRRKGKRCLIYPLWWNEKIDSCAPFYEEALAKWRSLTREEKARLKVICRKSTALSSPVSAVHKTFRVRF